MRVSRLVARHGWPILVLAALLVPPSIEGMRKAKVEYNILGYLPGDIDSMRGEIIIDRDFGDASNAFIIVENRTLREILALKERIAGVAGVRDVIGFDDIVSPNIPVELLPAAVRESFFSGKGSLLIVRFMGRTGSDGAKLATEGVRAILGEDAWLSSVSATTADLQALVEQEMPLYLGLAVGLVALILGITMGSWLIPIVFISQIGLAILYNLGSNALFGKISFLSQSLAAVLQLGVTMDFSIFLLHRYEEERASREDKREAMAAAIDKTLASISGSALTDVAGFMALGAMRLGIGLDIGLVMSKGVLIGFAGVLTILPAMILVLDGPIRRFRGKRLSLGFGKLASFVARAATPLAILFLLLFIPALYGRAHVVQDYDLSGGIPSTMPSARAERKLKEDYHMVTSHFVIARDDLSPVAKRDMIAELEKVEGVSGVLAFEKYLGALVPEEFLPESIRLVFSHGGRELMVVSSAYGVSMAAGREQLDRIIAITRRYDPGAMVTGEAALQKDLVAIAAEDFRRVDTVSILAILAIVLVLFGSLTIPVFLVGAIELAIIANLGLPYYLGQEIPFLAGIVIGCIQLGCTIDYSILLISRFREGIQEGRRRRCAAPSRNRRPPSSRAPSSSPRRPRPWPSFRAWASSSRSASSSRGAPSSAWPSSASSSPQCL
jgi:predicted RND superfamily exporter protein